MGYYFDEWRINFEALKKKVSQGISPTVFIKFSDEDPELNLRKEQVPQDPIFDNGIENKIVYPGIIEDDPKYENWSGFCNIDAFSKQGCQKFPKVTGKIRHKLDEETTSKVKTISKK